ncbi:DUF1302 domain-containing protein [Marinobacter vulgaris]|uniref:DUF1302 domain-containing protein n=1 Tax=Marinobacter vulgaris TaxID=1928331 RepID=A0A2V3ZI71_9GAMM|nr:DUF1302 domain-containing protein [Marinobacter vulgaris]PXX89834.1 DUF1302 domain-containing protein [Marinobacter vulgaris]TSJ68826.1 DUF1302 domain-containing protein [Marinobacter vulgaris]
MTKQNQSRYAWVKLPLAAAIAASLSAPAAAFQFRVGDVDAAFDTTLSAGATWRTEDADKRLIGQGNLQALGEDAASVQEGASTTNYDDGNLNFDKGDTVSKIVKGTSELYLDYAVDSDVLTRVGAFVRGRYWYDFELKDENRRFTPLSPDGKDNASGGEFLDAYVFTDWYLGNVPVSARYGNQVVSWGESTFIQGGINAINPIDVQAFRAPGSQVKDALLPVEMFYVSAGITENVTIEGFVQTDWEKTRIDDCGTFFSTIDFVADGCGPIWPQGQVPQDIAQAQYEQLAAMGIGGRAAIEREGDKDADSKDQFGVALRWYVPALNDSEFGFYFMQYNSRLPNISGVVADPTSGAGLPGRALPQYFIEYPENIKLYGISVNTTTPGGWSLGAEYSFREDVPLQWNAFELITGGLLAPNPVTNEPLSLLAQQRVEEAGVASAADLSGKAISGYDRFNVSQAQFTLIKFFDQIMGASRMSFITEFGATYVHDLPDYDEARYGRSGTFGLGTVPLPASVPGLGNDLCTAEAYPLSNINPDYCNNDGFTTDFSWGYRARFVWDYPNALAGVNLSPQLAWSHDVKGYAPSPGGAFNEGNKSIGLSLNAVYQNRISGNIGYTNYFGGKPYNVSTDRDFVSASVSYSF